MHVPALPGCVSEGDSLDEARQNIREAIELYLAPDEAPPPPQPTLTPGPSPGGRGEEMSSADAVVEEIAV